MARRDHRRCCRRQSLNDVSDVHGYALNPECFTETWNLRTSSSMPTSSIHYNVARRTHTHVKRHTHIRANIDQESVYPNDGNRRCGTAKSRRGFVYAFPGSILTRPHADLDRHQFPYVRKQDWRQSILPRGDASLSINQPCRFRTPLVRVGR